MEPGRVGEATHGGSVRRGGGRYFVASLTSQASALLRYVVLARLLGPEQLGLAAALTVTAGFFDLVSDTGSDRFLIQDREGGSPQVQKLVQLVYVVRGAAVAGTLVICAIPIAYLYNTPQLASGLALLALSPLISGFLHLDIRRLQRGHDFRSEAGCMIAADMAGLVAAIVGAWLTRNFMAVVCGMVTRAIVLVAGSHMQAIRTYRLGWDCEHAPRLARFAAPLMLNGLMLFIVLQGDRVIVGNQLGVTALGYYSAVVLLIYYPSYIVANYMHAIFIPVIAARRDSARDRNDVSDDLGAQTMMLAVAMAVGFAIVAPPMIPVLFGVRFAQPALLVGMIGVLQVARFLLGWPTTMALAMGRSTTVLMSNLAHFLIFPGALIGLRLIGGLTGVVAGFTGAELIAVAVALSLLNHATHRNPWHGFDRLGVLMLTGVAIGVWNFALGARSLPGCGAMLVVSVVLIVWLCRRERVVVAEAVAGSIRFVSAAFEKIVRKSEGRRKHVLF
jgi:O-antigen/teichoic acid export membrane protein